MPKFLDPYVKKKRLQYDRENLELAYKAVVEKGKSVYRAARDYQVPEMTLRDRVKGKINVNAKMGTTTLFTETEERALVEHITYMAKIGYGYTKTDIQYMAKDYAVSLGKKLQSAEDSTKLSNNWFYRFMDRWEELKIVKPQKLSIARAKNASPQKISNYFKELSAVLTNNNLHDKPARIYNIDETGVTTAHSPPKVVCDKETKPQSITSERSSTITLIAGGNAMGNFIPPYYVFPGKRWNPEFLEGAPAGADGQMSESGWSNMQVFHKYIKTHFANNVGISERNNEPILILYDGHRSHISLTLSEWAKKHNVILFVLPPHSSHLTQPLDVGVFGPFKNMYNRECSTFMQKNPGMCISKYDIATLTCQPYLKVMSPQNLVASFRKTGIYPFDNQAILPDETAPSAIYTCIIDDVTTDNVEGNSNEVDDAQDIQNVDQQDDSFQSFVTANSELSPRISFDDTQELTAAPLSPIEINNDINTQDLAVHNESQASEQSKLSFFETRKITKAVVKKPKRKFVTPYLVGNLAKKSNMEVIESNAKKQKLKENSGAGKKKPSKTISKKTKSTNVKGKGKSIKKIDTAKAGSSGISVKKGGPINLDPKLSEDSDIFTDDDEVCCVCDKWQPSELEHITDLIFVKWGKCDFCPHWTHLKFCSNVTVLRRASEFRCPHCTDK